MRLIAEPSLLGAVRGLNEEGEVAIVGMGRVIDRPWVVDGELTVRKVSQLTLAFDHRVCDGGTAGGFLRMLADYIEKPIAALGDL